MKTNDVAFSHFFEVNLGQTTIEAMSLSVINLNYRIHKPIQSTQIHIILYFLKRVSNYVRAGSLSAFKFQIFLLFFILRSFSQAAK